MSKIPSKTIQRIMAKPEAELDLHGLTKQQAEIELDDFLIKAEKLGWQKIRIIVGRGWNSPGHKSILRDFITDKLDNYGYNYTNAKIKQGGEGVLIVALY